MSWQQKLRTLIAAYQDGHPTVSIGLSYYTPLPKEQIDERAKELERELGIELPDELRELYSITDGMIIGLGNFEVHGLASRHNLCDENKRFLRGVQEECPTAHIVLIFGMDVTVDFFCVTRDGAVVGVDPHYPIEAYPVADSLELFFDDICLGPGYIRYNQLSEDDDWTSVLREFGFIEGSYDT